MNGLNTGAHSGEGMLLEVRCFSIAEAMPSPVTPAERRVRLGFERRTALVPADRLGEFRDAANTSDQTVGNEDSSEDRLADATADYFAATVGDPVFEKATERWITRDSYPETVAADVLTQADEWLHGLVERPLEQVAGSVTLPAPAAAMTAGIAAGVILEPIAEPLTKAAELCAVAGLVIGLAAGAPPLLLSSAKVLAHDAVNRVLAESIKEVFCDVEPEIDPIDRRQQIAEIDAEASELDADLDADIGGL